MRNSTALCIALIMISISACSEISTLKPDAEFEEGLSRSQRAHLAASLTGARVPTRLFMFPRDTRTPENMIYGVDISHHNRSLPWDTFLSNNIKFAYAKATEGRTWTDPNFSNYWRQLRDIQEQSEREQTGPFYRGAYHFFRPEKPAFQARHFIQTLGKKLPGDLPPCLDMEWTHGQEKDLWKRYSGKQITEWALEWLTAVEKEYGVTPIIYTNTYWWQSRGIQSEKLARFPIWVANYSESAFKNQRPAPLPDKHKTWRLWQFTDRGFMPGLNPAQIDVNSFNGTMAEFETFFELKSTKL